MILKIKEYSQSHALKEYQIPQIENSVDIDQKKSTLLYRRDMTTIA